MHNATAHLQRRPLDKIIFNKNTYIQNHFSDKFFIITKKSFISLFN
jgi:hypothetical protein